MSLPGERERAGGGGRRAGAQGAQPQPGQVNFFFSGSDPDPGSGAFLDPGSRSFFRKLKSSCLGQKYFDADPDPGSF